MLLCCAPPAVQGGFKSILSIENVTTHDAVNDNITGVWPSSLEEIAIAEKWGMTAVLLDGWGADFALQVSDMLIKLPKPIFLHCGRGWEATLYANLHLLRVGALAATDFYPASLAMGFDFQTDSDGNALVQQFTHLPMPITPPAINLQLAEGEHSYYFFYWPHRLSDTYYVMGQPLDTQVAVIAGSGYKSVVSFRANGEATSRLPTDPTTGPTGNHEFEDANGNYDVNAEQAELAAQGVAFYNLPVHGDSAFTAASYHAMAPQLAAAAALGPVLLHCAAGYRATAYAVVHWAATTQQCSPFALAQSRAVGFSYSPTDDAEVLAFFKAVLGC